MVTYPGRKYRWLLIRVAVSEIWLLIQSPPGANFAGLGELVLTPPNKIYG